MVIFKISALEWNNCGKRNVKKSALEIWQMSNLKQSALKWSMNIFEHPIFSIFPCFVQGSSTVFLPSGPGAVGDVSAQIRNGLLTGAAGAPGQLTM
jgi:hypothetical protein